MKVYLAARFSLKEDLKQYRDDLTVNGMECTSTWLEENISPTANLGDVTPEYAAKTANQDIRDILRSDVTVLFTEDPTVPTVRGGRHFESGFTYGLAFMEKQTQIVMRPHVLVTVGPLENVFHFLADVHNFSTWEEARVWLLEQAERVRISN